MNSHSIKSLSILFTSIFLIALSSIELKGRNLIPNIHSDKYDVLNTDQSSAINEGDTIVFDLSQASFNGSVSTFPVSFISDDQIFALDFSFNFNIAEFSYSSVANLALPVVTAQVLANYNTADQKLRLTSNDFNQYPINTNIVSLSFATLQADICQIGLTNIVTYLNGEPCSYKIIGCSNAPAYAGLDQSICADFTTLQANQVNFGTGSWSVLSGSGIFQDASLPNSQVNGLALGENVFRWTMPATGNSPLTVDDVIITRSAIPSQADAGENQIICADNTSLQAVAPLVGQGLWTVIQGSATFQDASNPTTTVSTISTGDNVYEWVVSNGTCPTTSAQVIVFRKDTVYAGLDQTLCGDSTFLDALIPADGQGFWTVLSGNGTFSDSTLSTTQVSGLALGVNIFQWNVIGSGCIDSTDQMIVTVICNVPPVIFNDSVDLFEDGDASGNFLDNGDFDPDGPGLIINIIPVSGPTNGTIIINSDGSFTYTPDLNFFGQDTVIVNICDQGIPSIPLPAICVQDTLFVNVIPVNDPPVVVNENVFTVFGTPAIGNVLDNDTDPENTNLSVDLVIVDEPNNGSFILNPDGSFSYDANPGFLGIDTIVVSVCDSGFPLPQICVLDTIFIEVGVFPFSVFAGDDSSICDSTYLLLGSTIPPGATGIWTQSLGAGIIESPSNDSTLVTNLNLGDNTFIWTVTYNSFSISDSVTIKVLTPAEQALAGLDQTNCRSDGALIGNSPISDSGVWTVLASTAIIDNPASANTAVSNLTVGENVFIWTITNGSCSTSDTTSITRLESPLVSAGPDTSICAYQVPLNVSISISGADQWTWTTLAGNASIDGALSNSPTFSDLSIGNNTFLLTADNGTCSASDSLTIFVNSNESDFCNNLEIFIPAGFSPNDDGDFDVFQILNLNGLSVEIQVFNRWGFLVYESADYQNNWNGTSNNGFVIAGDRLPEGTYFYLIQIEGETEPRKGILTLWR